MRVLVYIKSSLTHFILCPSVEKSMKFLFLAGMLFAICVNTYAYALSGENKIVAKDQIEQQQDSVPQDSTQQDTTRVEIVAIKNNLLYDATLTPNLQLEFRLTQHWSLEFGVGFNPFPLNDMKFPKWRHVMVSITPRYWICNVFHRDFVSFNAAYAHYNVGGFAYPVSWMYPQTKTHRYQGDAVMVGLSYGWHWAISPHFSIELEGGIDGGYTWYKKFKCEHCGDRVGEGGRWFLLPKVGLNLSFPLGGDELSMAKRCDCEKVEDKQDTVLAVVDTVVPEPVDTVVPEPVDTVVPEPVDTVVPVVVPVDTVLAVVDTVVPEPVDTVVPEPVVVEPVEPEKDIQSAEMQRLRSALLRDESEYVPYNTSMALSADPRNTFVYFPVDVAKLDRNFIENDKLMDSIMFIIGDALRDTLLEITRIQIVGYASFDGRLAYNIGLAENRAKTIKEYIQSLFGLGDDQFAVCNGGESWAELRYKLEEVEFEGKDEVLRIIDTEPDLEMREKKIKALHGGATYRYMRDELKKIMRNLGCITVFCKEKTVVVPVPQQAEPEEAEKVEEEKPTKRIVQRDWEKHSVKKVQNQE